jgi:hypothetical protein
MKKVSQYSSNLRLTESYTNDIKVSEAYTLEDIESCEDGPCYHREDGPAFISYYSTGERQCEYWFIRDKLNRKNGPSIIQYHRNQSVIAKTYMVDSTKVSVNYFRVLCLVTSNVKGLASTFE